MKKLTVYNIIITDFFQYWKTIVWLTIVFFLSTMTVPDVSSVPLVNIPHFDKIIHFSMYFILATLWMLDDFKKTKAFRMFNLIIIMIFSISYGLLMEVVQQIIVQDRTGDILDVLANTIGVIIAILIFRNINFYRKILINLFI